eukprot:12639879-Alexandrium_andersonii.AAC.1
MFVRCHRYFGDTRYCRCADLGPPLTDMLAYQDRSPPAGRVAMDFRLEDIWSDPPSNSATSSLHSLTVDDIFQC